MVRKTADINATPEPAEAPAWRTFREAFDSINGEVSKRVTLTDAERAAVAQLVPLYDDYRAAAYHAWMTDLGEKPPEVIYRVVEAIERYAAVMTSTINLDLSGSAAIPVPAISHEAVRQRLDLDGKAITAQLDTLLADARERVAHARVLVAEHAEQLDYWLRVPICGDLLRAFAAIESEESRAFSMETFDIFASRAMRYAHGRDGYTPPHPLLTKKKFWLPILLARVGLGTTEVGH